MSEPVMPTTWTSLLGAEIRFIEAAGVRTRLLDAGRGAPLVLLHGRGGHLEVWSRAVPALVAAGRRVVAFDLLGHGLTAPAGRHYDIPELLAHATAVLDELGIDRADLVGQSLGGWVSAEFALARPERVRRLVLVGPAGLQAEHERLADPRIERAYREGGRAFDEPSRENVRRRIAQLVADPAAIPDEMISIRAALYETDAARAVHRAVRAADNDRHILTPARLADLTATTLLVHGEHGHLSQEVLQAASAAVPGGRIATVAGTKQWPHYEHAEQFTHTILCFLEDDA